jgi:hypothetical protein
MTTQILNDLVREYFSGNEWSITFEVGNGTGFSVKRHADAVAMNLWPSRGLALHGIEIKASRGDWQKEMADPAKAEEIHQHCDYWWLAAAHGVVKDIEEIPPGWGFFEASKPTEDRPPRLKLRRQATKQIRPDAVNRGFVAAILRANQRAESVEFSRALEKRVEGVVEQRVESVLKFRQQEKDQAVERLAKLTAACEGIEGGIRWTSDDEICRAVAFVLKCGATSSYGGILGLIESFEGVERTAQHAAATLRSAAEAVGLPVTRDTELFRRRA